jgi:hypothetical protein
MKLWATLTVILIVALILTNGGWFWGSMNSVVTDKYQGQMLYERAEMLKDLIAISPELAKGKSKEEIVSLAEAATGEESYEKEGAVWAGWLGLVFNENGELVEVIPTWSYGEGIPPL